MDIRTSDITQRLAEWLDRYSVPQHMREKPDAVQKEVEALARILCKFCPHQEYVPFLNRVFATLEYGMKTRVWPTVNELGAACSNARKENPAQGEIKPPKNEYEIMADRMAKGEAVGEGYLWGRQAVEMIRLRLVDEPTMKSYRSGAFLARRELYGEAAALAWEAECKERHAAAKEILRNTKIVNGRVTIAPNRMESAA
jgi:hypothetical protein